MPFRIWGSATIRAVLRPGGRSREGLHVAAKICGHYARTYLQRILPPSDIVRHRYAGGHKWRPIELRDREPTRYFQRVLPTIDTPRFYPYPKLSLLACLPMMGLVKRVPIVWLSRRSTCHMWNSTITVSLNSPRRCIASTSSWARLNWASGDNEMSGY